jgi:hypothetical protein
METIDDILREMRKRFEPYAKSESNDARYVAYLGYAEFPDRIETVVKALVADRDNWRRQALAEDARANAATCENSSQVGNAAKMREALEDSNGLLEELSRIGEWYESANGQIKENNYALSAPARNCDRFENYEDALSEFENQIRIEGRLGFINPFTEVVNWLLAEAKGERQ